jgi:hypothetical protein
MPIDQTMRGLALEIDASTDPSPEARPLLEYRFIDLASTQTILARITGIPQPGGGGELAFETNAGAATTTQRMLIDNKGNVGIGTENPGARLEVAGDVKFNGPLNIEGALRVSGVAKIGGDLSVTGKVTAGSFAGNGAGLSNVTPDDNSVTSAKLAQDSTSLSKVSGGLMAIRDSKLVGFGTGRPERHLHICDDSDAEIILEQSKAKSDFKRWNIVADGGDAQTPAKFYIRQLNDAGSGGNVPLMINGEGRVIITKLQLGNKWLLSGDRDWAADDDWLRLANTQVGDYWGGFAAGRLYSIGGIVQGSDLRFKTDVSSLVHMVDKLVALRAVRFKWRNAREEDSYRIGLIAQEVENIIPEVVETGPDGMKGINYAGLVAAIIGVLQDQEVELRKLRAEVALLRAT